MSGAMNPQPNAATRTDKLMLVRAVSPIQRDGPGPKLAKTFERQSDGTWASGAAYQDGYLFDAADQQVDDIDALHALIRRAAQVPQLAVMRGGLKGGATSASSVRRLLYDRPGERHGHAAFEARPTTFIPVDVDGLSLPDGLALDADMDRIVDHVVSQLPPWLSGASFVWQRTASWGVKPGIRLRLYALADTDVSGEDLKALFEGYPVDLAVFGPVQLTYTAAPIFLGGEDPVATRLGIRRGVRDRAEIGKALAALRAKGASRLATAVSRTHGLGIGFDGYLAIVGDEPIVPGGQGFHGPLKSAVASAFGAHGAQLDVTELERHLGEVIRERAALSGRSASYVSARLRDLPKLIRNIQTLQARREADAARVLDDAVAGIVRPTLSADEVAAQLPPAFGQFFRAAEPVAVERLRDRARSAGATGIPATAGARFHAPLAPQRLALVDLGVGKTEAAIDEVIAYVESSAVTAARGDMPAPRVGFVVNDHSLAVGIAARINAKRPGLASVWLGMERPDPDADGQTMCRRVDDAAEWRRAGGSVAQMCAQCPYGAKSSDPCSYIRQNRTASVVILAGPTTLASAPPSKLKRTLRVTTEEGAEKTIRLPAFDVVLVDETRAPAWVAGFGPSPVLAEVGLAAGKLRPPSVGATRAKRWGPLEWQDLDDRLARLDAMLARLVGALEHGATAHPRYSDLRRVIDTADGWLRLRKDLFATLMNLDKRDAALMGGALRAALSGIAGWNARILMLARFAEVAAQALDARLDDGGEYPDNAPVPLMLAGNGATFGTGLRLRWREPLAKAWSDMPTLVLDGTADAEILRLWWPRLETVADGRAVLPDVVEVVQVADTLAGFRGWSPKAVDANSSTTAHADRQRAMSNVERVANFLDVVCARWAAEGGVGLVGPKGLVEELERLWAARGAGRPTGLVVGHHGAIRGRDEFSAVRVLINLSRICPSPAEVEDIAEVLWCRPVERLPPGAWYERKGRFHIVRSGGVRRAERGETHPDPLAERVRRQLSDAEADQADGRARAVRRGARTPLTLIRATALPSDRLPVDEFVTMRELMATADDAGALAARGVVVPVRRGRGGGGLKVTASLLGVELEALKSRRGRTRGVKK